MRKNKFRRKRELTKIYLVRHAESFGNLSRRAYGWYDGIVTEKGWAQIECLKKCFENIEIDAVYSSDRARTMATAEAIYKPKGLSLITMPSIREISLGIWEDRPWGEFPRRDPEAYKNWCEAPLLFKLEGAETFRELYERMKSSLLKIASENEGKTVAVVSHGAAIRTLLCGILDNDNLEDLASCDWGDNTCVSLLSTEDGVSFKAEFLNDNSHLSHMAGFADNMRWAREDNYKTSNLYFVPARFPEDKEKLRNYYGEAWKLIFGDGRFKAANVDVAVRRMLKLDSESVLFGMNGDDEVGVVAFDRSERLLPDTGHISFIYLKEEFRGKRFGIQLVGAAVSRYKELGMKKVSIRVAETNLSAIAFYKKYGFYEAFRETENKVSQIVMVLEI